MIVAKDLGLTYTNGTVALNVVNLRIGAGELIYITGPSGSGKTSLLKLLMGMERPSFGTLQVLNQPITKGQQSKIQKMRRGIGPIFQEFRLLKGHTAMENVMMGMRFMNLSPAEIKENAVSALIRVGLEHKLLTDVNNLSFGECQRVAIARAVARKPTLILADEPTGNLDQKNALNILSLLSSFKDEKTSVLITTHATHLIEHDTEAKILRVNNGHVQWKGEVCE